MCSILCIQTNSHCYPAGGPILQSWEKPSEESLHSLTLQGTAVCGAMKSQHADRREHRRVTARHLCSGGSIGKEDKYAALPVQQRKTTVKIRPDNALLRQMRSFTKGIFQISQKNHCMYAKSCRQNKKLLFSPEEYNACGTQTLHPFSTTLERTMLSSHLLPERRRVKTA